MKKVIDEFLLFSKKMRYRLHDTVFHIPLLLLVVPIIWIPVFIANFLLCSLILFFAFKLLKQKNIWLKYKRSIFKITCFGLIADLGAALINCLIGYMFVLFGKNISTLANTGFELIHRPYKDIGSIVIACLALVLAGIFIYKFNNDISFKGLNISDRCKKILAMTLAILTPPITITIPYLAYVYNVTISNSTYAEYVRREYAFYFN